MSTYTRMGTVTATVIVSREPDRSGNFYCDGTADDVEIQAALIYVNVLGGGEVILLEGIYNITALLLVYDDTRLAGVGYASTLFLVAGSNCSVVSNADRVGGNTNIVVEHLHIDANRANQGAYGRPIDLKGVTYSKILYNYCHGAYEGPVAAERGIGILFQVSEHNLIEGNVCWDNGHGGIELRNASHHNSIIGNFCYDNDWNGIQIVNGGEESADCNYNTIVGNVCYANDNYGITVHYSTKNDIVGNICHYNVFYGIMINDAADINVVGNFCAEATEVGVGLGIRVEATSLRVSITGNFCVGNASTGIRILTSNCMVTGNYCISNTYHGIYLEPGADACTCTGNFCTLNGWAGIYVKSDYNAVTGNTCTNNCQTDVRAGIYLSEANYNTITANVCTDTQGTKTQDYGISSTGTNQNNVIGFNIVHGNQTGGILVTNFDGTNKIEENVGYNVVGNIATPFPAGAGYLLDVAAANAFPASGAVYTAGHSPKLVCISGGTVTQIAIDGVNTNLTEGAFHLNPGNTITVTWDVQPLGVVSAC